MTRPPYNQGVLSETSFFSTFSGGTILSTSRMIRLPNMVSMISWSDFDVMLLGTDRARFFLG